MEEIITPFEGTVCIKGRWRRLVNLKHFLWRRQYFWKLNNRQYVKYWLSRCHTESESGNGS